MAGAGKGWNNNAGEVDAPWSDVLEYEIAYVLAGKPSGARTITDGNVNYNFGNISKSELKYRKGTKRGGSSGNKAKSLTMTSRSGSVDVKFTMGGPKGAAASQADIEPYLNAALTNRLAQILPVGTSTEVFFSSGGNAHTDICFIEQSGTGVTNWRSFHAKHNTPSGGRVIGISKHGCSVFYNSVWDESQEAKRSQIEDAYNNFHAQYTADQRNLTGTEFTNKFNTDATFKEDIIEYVYQRMIGLKASVIKSTWSAGQWAVLEQQNENWDMRSATTRAVLHPSRSTVSIIEIETPIKDDQTGVTTDQFIGAFEFVFRQDPARKGKGALSSASKIAEFETFLNANVGKEYKGPEATNEGDPATNDMNNTPGWTLQTRTVRGSTAEYYVYVGGTNHDETIPVEEVSRAGQINTAPGNADVTIQQAGHKIGESNVSKRHKQIVERALRMILEAEEELSPEGKEELNAMSLDDLLSFADEPIGDEGYSSSESSSSRIDESRWLKLAGLLKD